MRTNQTDRSGCDIGKSRKMAAHVLLEAHRGRTIRNARRVLLQHLLDYGTATIDDVRAVIELPDGVDPVCLGTVPGYNRVKRFEVLCIDKPEVDAFAPEPVATSQPGDDFPGPEMEGGAA